MDEFDFMNMVKKIIIEKANSAYGFCGVAEGEAMVMINTGENKDLTIKIEVRK